MTQIATVTAVPRPGVAVVSVARQTACGHDCEHCAGCGAQGGTVTVQARTEIAVSPGDQVELFSGKQVLGIAALVYLAPVGPVPVGLFSQWAADGGDALPVRRRRFRPGHRPGGPG